MGEYYVYNMTNASRTLCIGVTNNLVRRVQEHPVGQIPGFTKKYNIHKLVYFEQGDDINSALFREKQMKKWRREKKIAVIESVNPEWRDLSENWKY
jgi:putative endonuclease